MPFHHLSIQAQIQPYPRVPNPACSRRLNPHLLKPWRLHERKPLTPPTRPLTRVGCDCVRQSLGPLEARTADRWRGRPFLTRPRVPDTSIHRTCEDAFGVGHERCGTLRPAHRAPAADNRGHHVGNSLAQLHVQVPARRNLPPRGAGDRLPHVLLQHHQHSLHTSERQIERC